MRVPTRNVILSLSASICNIWSAGPPRRCPSPPSPESRLSTRLSVRMPSVMRSMPSIREAGGRSGSIISISSVISRPVSRESRTVGPLTLDEIYGRVLFVAFPFNEIRSTMALPKY